MKAARELRIAFIDLECKPGHWIGGDFVSRILTAVAFTGLESDDVGVYDHYDHTLADLADIAADVYETSDIIVGHYERGFDLPLINGMLEREGFRPLPPKLTLDTKLDRIKTLGRSQSQKNLSADYGLDNPKIDVTLRAWEGFNDREPEYRDIVRERVEQDVRQCRALYIAQRDLGMLGEPKVMSFRSGGSGGYRP